MKNISNAYFFKNRPGMGFISFLCLLLLIPAFYSCKPKASAGSDEAEGIQGNNQKTFSVFLDNKKIGNVNGLLELEDGSFLAVGGIKLQKSNDFNGSVIKLGKKGNVIQEKIYNQPGGQFFNKIIRASDSGFVVLGIQQLEGRKDWDIFVTQLDNNLEQKWQHHFGGTGYENSNEIIATHDHGYIIAGQTNSRGMGKNDFYVIKLTATGEVQWEKTYGTDKNELARTVVQAGDNYLVAGPGMVKKIDSSGNELWTRMIGDEHPVEINSCTEADSDTYLFAGMITFQRDEFVTYGNFYLMAMNQEGDIIWEKHYNYPGRLVCYVESIRKTLDGNFISGGAVSQEDDTGTDVALMKVDIAGNELWKTTYDKQGDEHANIVIPVSDGGYLAGGFSSKKSVKEVQGRSEITYLGNFGFVFKFNSSGRMK